MKPFFYFITFFIGSLTINAQTITGKVSSDNKSKGLENVKLIIVKDNSNKPVATTISDKRGNFYIDLKPEPNTNYQLIASFIGYKTIRKSFSSNNIPQKMNLKLESSSTKLKEVDIAKTRARAVIIGDTVIYDAKAFKTHEDANVEDLVTKMPGITKENGEVKAYGEKVQKVLVDGQEFFGDDANIALKNLPAETVDQVQVYDALNDRDAFTGNTTGNTTKTMNLKTKPGMNKGMFGKAYAGYGTNDRYQAGGNYNYYNGTKRISFLGLANNINNLNFSTSEIVGAMTGSSIGAQGAQMRRGMQFGMSVSSSGRSGGFRGPMSNFTVSNQGGVNKAYSFGVNYNDKWGARSETKVNFSYFGNRTDNLTLATTSQTSLLDTLNTLNTSQNQTSESENYSHKFTSRIDGRLDKKNSYIWTNKLSLGDNTSTDLTELNNSFENRVGSLGNTNQTNTSSQSVAFNTNLLYKLAFNRVGRTFSVNSIIDLNSQDGKSVQNVTNEIRGTSQSFGLDYNTRQWNSTITNVLTYTEPSGKYGQWLFNYSPSFSNRINDREVGTFDMNNTSPMISDSLSGKFTNNIFYNVGGVSYRLQYNNFRIMFGSSVQNISFSGRERFPGSSSINKDFFGLLPYINIKFKKKPMTRMRLTYNTSMNVPSITEIQPVLDLSNPVSIYKGNENLSNEYSHNVFFHYMKPNIVKGTFLIFVSNLNYTNDNISSFSYTAVNDTTIDQIALRRGITYNKYVNLDNAFSGFIFGNYTLPVKPLKSNFSLNGNYTYTQTPSIINLQENFTKTNMFSVGMMLSSNISKNVDYSLSYNPKYLLNSFTIDGLPDNNYWIHTINNNLKLTLFKDIVWSYDFSYNYNSQIEPSLNQHIFLLGSSLAYKFLKSKKLEAKITVFDIFNQNQDISRTITNNTIIDTRVNAMNRYGLFTLTYHFKKFQGTDPSERKGGFMRMMRHGS